MGAICIVNKGYARYSGRYNACDISDYIKLYPHVQPIVTDKALNPDVTLSFANTNDMLCLIHIAKADNGKYYFGYSLHIGDAYSGCNPSVMHNKWNKECDSYVNCILEALKYCCHRKMCIDEGDNRRLAAAAKKAIREVNRLRLRQISIFDMLFPVPADY